MRNALALFAVVLAAAVTISPAAARDDGRVRGRAEIHLGDFEIVIGDTGGREDSWDSSPTRVEIEVLDNWESQTYYFDSLPNALFVLRQLYGQPSILSLKVMDYARGRLTDGARAYYIWDYEHCSRGGVPLLLAFKRFQDAQQELRYRDGVIMEFAAVVKNLYRWAERERDLVYWRGWDRDRWDDESWQRAWDERWHGWEWDERLGWLIIKAHPDSDDPGMRHGLRRGGQRDGHGS